MLSGIRSPEVTEIKPSEPAAFENPFEVDYDFASNDFLDWSSRKAEGCRAAPVVTSQPD